MLKHIDSAKSYRCRHRVSTVGSFLGLIKSGTAVMKILQDSIFDYGCSSRNLIK